MIHKEDIQIVNSNLGLEALFSIYLYNLQYQPIVSPYFMKYEPYDYQKYILLKSNRSQILNLFLADEVGLGKTIEALLIIQELILKNNYKKILIILPKNLINQWELEITNWTYLKSQLSYCKVDSSSELIEIISDKENENILLICSAGLLVYKNNFAKNEIDWDLIVVDEIHHARSEEHYSSMEEKILEKRNKFYRCLKLLGGRSKSILFLSATPIQLNITEFKKLIQIRNEELFYEMSFDDYQNYQSFLKILYLFFNELGAENLTTDELFITSQINEFNELLKNPQNLKFWNSLNNKYLFLNNNPIENYFNSNKNLELIKSCLKKEHLYCKILIRNRKRDIFNKLKDRGIIDCPVEMHKTYKTVYLKIDDLVSKFEEEIFEDSDGKIYFKRAIKGYLISSYREYMVSSKEQIKKSLENRLSKNFQRIGRFYKYSEEFQNIKKILIELGNLRVENDNKLNKLNDILLELKENKRIIIFARYYATIDFLKDKLEGFHNKELYLLTGEHTPTLEKREEIINDFNQKGGILLATDIGGEGLNLQSSNIIINYDLHWNPTKLEQRIGRIDRIGQDKKVIVYNIYYKDSVAGKIYTVLKRRLNLQTQSFGDIDPILEDISEEIRLNETNVKMFEPLMDLKIEEYKKKFDERFKEFKKDLILKEESYDENYFNALKPYIPKLNFVILLNYLNLLIKNDKDLIYQDYSDYYDNQFFYLNYFVYYIKTNTSTWANILKTIKSPYLNVISQYIKFENYNNCYINLPKFKKAINYYHGIGDPSINLLINYFGLKFLQNKDVLLSKVVFPSLMEEGYIFFYEVDYKCQFFTHKIIIPLFFNNDGYCKAEFSKKIIMDLLGKCLYIKNNPDPSVDFTQINYIPYDSVINREIENYKDIIFKEQNRIKDQRIFEITSNYDYLINKKNKDFNLYFNKKLNLKNKIQLSKTEQTELRYADTRIETLQKNLRLLTQEKNYKLNKFKDFKIQGKITKKLIIIFKLEKFSQDNGELFKISNPFENKSEEIYIGQEFSYKINCLQDLTQFFNEIEDLEFQVRLNNDIINSNKINVKQLNEQRFHEIYFTIKSEITDVININLYCVSNSIQILLYSNENIKIYLYSLFIEENNQLSNITGNKDYSINLDKKYTFSIKSIKDIKEILLYTKNINEIDELIKKIDFLFIKNEGKLNIYKFDYTFEQIGNYFFRILGLNCDSNLLVIPNFSIEFPDLSKTDNFIISDLNEIFITIKGNNSVFTQNFLNEIYLTLTNKRKHEIYNNNLNAILKKDNQLINFENQDQIKIKFISFIPNDLCKLRLGEFNLILKFNNFSLQNFNFKMFPIIRFSFFDQLKIFEGEYKQKITVFLKDPEHILINPYLKYKDQDIKFKYINQKEQIKCECSEFSEIYNNENFYYTSIFPQITSLFAGEYYELKVNTNYQIKYGNNIPGPTLCLGDFGLNRLQLYEGKNSKYLIFYNTGFKTISINNSIYDLISGLNVLKLLNKDKPEIKIEVDGNFLRIISLIQNEKFDINEIKNELIASNNDLKPEIFKKLSDNFKFLKDKAQNYKIMFINSKNFDFRKFIFDIKKFFNNIYIIYPTVELFQDEILEIIKEAIASLEFNDINLNLMTYPTPIENIIYEKKIDAICQQRKVIPIILKKCNNCLSIKKFDEITNNSYCFCNNNLNYEQLPEIYEISSKILLNCPKCNKNIYILYKKNSNGLVEFICGNCNFKTQKINIFFKRFKFSQTNSINFMTSEQFDYSISHNIIENKEIKNLQLGILNKLKDEEIIIKKFWKDNYPQELRALKDNYLSLKKKITKSKLNYLKVNDLKISKNQETSKKNSSIKRIFKSIFNSIKDIFRKKHKSILNIKNNENINSKTHLNKELIDEYKKIEKIYFETNKNWKNKINSFFGIDLISQSKEFTKIEEFNIDDLIKVDEFDLLQEMDENNRRFSTNDNYLNINAIKFLQYFGIINEYLDLNENYLEIIKKILENQSDFQLNNLFLFMDLNNVKETENKYIMNYSYIKKQLIYFNNTFCQSSDNNIGLVFY